MTEFNLYAIAPEPEASNVTNITYVDLEAHANQYFPADSFDVTPVEEIK